MASRLYPTTRRLFGQVMQGLVTLRFGAVLSPLVLSLMTLYITGLLLPEFLANSLAGDGPGFHELAGV